jgi:hypothetical protein
VSPASRLLRAGVTTAISDGLFATILSVAVFGSTFSRLWQGVASTLIGASAFTGGARTTVLGMAMHVGVAFGWSAVFIFGVMRSTRVQAILASRYGVFKVAAVYGPAIWLVMSLAVIPILLHRPPALTMRWLVQLVGHFPFVGLPIVAMGSRGRGGP